jgi:hypothetical protein
MNGRVQWVTLGDEWKGGRGGRLLVVCRRDFIYIFVFIRLSGA